MEQIQESTEALLQTIRRSSAFNRYETCRKQLEAYPEKLSQMNNFRRKVYEMQNADEVWDRIEEMNRLFEERERVRQDPLIAAFLDAELELCRMLQTICTEIMSIADLSLDEMENSL